MSIILLKYGGSHDSFAKLFAIDIFQFLYGNIFLDELVDESTLIVGAWVIGFLEYLEKKIVLELIDEIAFF